MTAYDDLMAFQRDTEALGQIAQRLGWDQETMMPRGAAGQRSDEVAALEAVLHARRTDPRIGDWLAAAEPRDAIAAANLRRLARTHARETRVPARLAAELARQTSLAQGIWAEARAAEDVAAFLPTLAQVLALKREEAAALAAGGDLYDALLEGYEPGTTAAALAALFDRMRPRLVALRAQVLGAEHQPLGLAHVFGDAGQLAISDDLARRFGYDFNRGRIDRAVHPFSSGSGADVRITTRISPTDPFNCFYSTLHEVGHACYEQNIAPRHALTPLGNGVSMAVHESQSRIYENQLGRSNAFGGWLYERMRREFGDFGIADAEAFYGTLNRVQPGFIRTEADEVQYNLHIMMRFDLERALVAGTLEVVDLEAAWNDRFLADFGAAVDRPSNGLLQDVHWAIGYFGYFPTYALGNVYAGCLFQALRRDVPGLDDGLAEGDARAATDWLAERVQCHGGLLEPRALITQACGFAPDEVPLLTYLDTKYAELYRL